VKAVLCQLTPLPVKSAMRNRYRPSPEAALKTRNGRRMTAHLLLFQRWSAQGWEMHSKNKKHSSAPNTGRAGIPAHLSGYGCW
jgi:hypothetical protein